MTYVTDQNDSSSVVLSLPNLTWTSTPIYETKGRISEYGFDAGLPVLRTTFVDADLYYGYAQFVHFGHGNAVGILGAFRGLGIVNASAKLEHQWIGNEFIPEYFDQFYELERYIPDNATGFINSKAQELDSTKKSQGWYGQLMWAFSDSSKLSVTIAASTIIHKAACFILRLFSRT